ncbi:alpha/beta hydrolase [Pedobacter sp. L105]|uniref:alpha/beta hydrolase n=1 Tax=Pedobacter sp. L105 TaxID=1641871 RepID=UPI00131C442C|nr:alpha/beta hydrolase [Pedobacter sp. L105]
MTSTRLTTGDHFKLFLFRKIVMPLVEVIGRSNYPKDTITELSYGNLPDEKLDYIKPNKLPSSRIAIVHIHGGAFIGGSKGRLFARPLLAFSDAGYPVFSLNYPLAPEYPHPQPLRSLLKALAFIKKEFPDYSVIHLTGDSAGGLLAMMLGIILSNPKLLPVFDSIDAALLPEIKSIVPLYGVFDRVEWIKDGFPLSRLFFSFYAGEKALIKEYVPPIPIAPMDLQSFENLPPVFIVVGSEDNLQRVSRIYAEHLRKQFNTIEFKIYEGGKHGFFSVGAGNKELINDLLNYYKKF